MRLTLRQLRLFCAVAATGSTTAAAANLALSQSATSAALIDLEDILGARLFDRIGKRLVLNDAGRMLLPEARSVLDAAQGIETAFSNGMAGGRWDLHIAASTTIGNYLLPALLASFRRDEPAGRVAVRIGNTREVSEAIVGFGADLGLIEGPCHAADVTVLPWIEDELVVVAAPAHPLARAARRGRLGVQALRNAPWLLREPGSGTREAVEHALLPHLSHLPAAMTLGSSEAIKNAVGEGLGLSCLSRCVVADQIKAKRLVVVASTLPRLTRRFALIHHRRKTLSIALRAFIAHCGVRV